MATAGGLLQPKVCLRGDEQRERAGPGAQEGDQLLGRGQGGKIVSE